MSDSDNGQKKNIYAYRMGTNDGEVRFGHVTADNQISSCLLRSGFFFNHYITLDGTGERHRAGGTIARSPGAFQVKAGDNCGPNDMGVFLNAVNGDILLSAPNGKIILDAQNILVRASGQGGSTGTGIIDIEANEKVNITGKGDGVEIQGTSVVKIFSDKTVDVIGQTALNCYGGFIDMADGNSTAAIAKSSKTGVKAQTTAVSASFGIIDAITGLIGPDKNLEDKMKSFQSLFKSK